MRRGSRGSQSLRVAIFWHRSVTCFLCVFFVYASMSFDPTAVLGVSTCNGLCLTRLDFNGHGAKVLGGQGQLWSELPGNAGSCFWLQLIQ